MSLTRGLLFSQLEIGSCTSDVTPTCSPGLFSCIVRRLSPLSSPDPRRMFSGGKSAPGGMRACSCPVERLRCGKGFSRTELTRTVLVMTPVGGIPVDPETRGETVRP